MSCGRSVAGEYAVEEGDLFSDEGLEHLSGVGLEVPGLVGGQDGAGAFVAALIAGRGGVVWSFVPTCTSAGTPSFLSPRPGE